MDQEQTFYVWHKQKHDDFCLTEFKTHVPHRTISSWKQNGGFWKPRKEGEKISEFVPWHSITYIECR